MLPSACMKRWLVLLAVGCTLAGCTLGPDYRRPEIPVSAKWRTPTAAAGSVADLAWWELFRWPTRCGSANRDRFVLSMGHASMLLYWLLHLAGVKAVDPDYERLGESRSTTSSVSASSTASARGRWTSGIETTTGPLGQGVATSLGMGKAVSRRRQR
jgi:transketolase